LVVDDEDEDDSRPWLMWVLIGIAVAAVAGIIWLFASQDREPPITSVTVPPLQNKTQEDAMAKLAEFELTAKFLPEPHDTIEEGLVTRSDPPSGESVEKGTEIGVYYSEGPAEVEIPDVAGESQEEAVRILAENDLGISRVDPQDVPGTPADEVVNTD